jgi:hypothetical protein
MIESFNNTDADDRSVDPSVYKWDSKLFFEAPLSQFRTRMSDFAKQHDSTSRDMPSHVLTYGAILHMGQTEDSLVGPTIKDALMELGYREVWTGRQPLDWIARESADQGGVRIWALDPAVARL